MSASFVPPLLSEVKLSELDEVFRINLQRVVIARD